METGEVKFNGRVSACDPASLPAKWPLIQATDPWL